jgi:acetaldehyde dehydrogenase/alcohol dehydrogenase
MQIRKNGTCEKGKLLSWCWLVAPAVALQVVAELKKRGAYIMTKAEGEQAGKVIIQEGRLNANVVGQPATKLAELFGFKVPGTTKVREPGDLG